MKESEEFKKISKKQVIIGGVVVALVLVGGYFVLKEYNKKKLEAQVTLSPEIYTVPEKEKINIDSEIVPTKTKNLFVNGPNEELDEIEVEDGQSIQEGTTLFKCKNEKVISEIEDLKEKIQNKQNERNNLKTEEEKKNITEDIDELNKKVANLEELAYKSVNAPFSGVVYLGEENHNENPAIMILESNELYVKGQVSEDELSKISLNQEVDILVNSTKQKLKGKIIYVGQRPSRQDSKKDMSYYDIKIGFLENQDLQNIKNGFHVKTTAEVINHQIKVPYTALLQTDEKRFVYKVIDGIIYKQEVKTSETNEKYAVITEGVGENDKIIKNADNKDIKEGEKIIINEK